LLEAAAALEGFRRSVSKEYESAFDLAEFPGQLSLASGFRPIVGQLWRNVRLAVSRQVHYFRYADLYTTAVEFDHARDFGWLFNP
jgi:hypothetical protein